MVEDARDGELSKKEHIQQLNITFYDEMDGVEDWQWVGVIDALEPHPNLRILRVYSYAGSKLPGWIESPLNQVKFIYLDGFGYLSTLPPLGKLPCLEEIEIREMSELQFVGQEFLGITTPRIGDKTNTTIGFPKLKKLTFRDCPNLKEWEDISAEEEESSNVSLMPCLTELIVNRCRSLKALPHRLLRKAASSSLMMLDMSYSTQLQQRYNGETQSSEWKFIFDVSPRLKLIQWYHACI
ncbi:disease resistance protein rga2 [Phtheirospermum japonicum]|uniref:Disease resistance protein rga2 n=1 Tax=Phtheirospermum japonicum TaxID=374723 RepID=A0A830D3R2_9LAMI|nr:disease resistance protein rga2 [Phtheirospermum japonicum]